jgi:hypothetical protein
MLDFRCREQVLPHGLHDPPIPPWN